MNAPAKAILIVEDETVSRRILAAMVKRQGFEPIEADSCEQGRKLYEKRLPSLIFLDIDLMDGSGIDYCKWVRDREDGEKVPIIMGTAHNEREYIARSIKAGANDFVIKPFKALAIKERLDKYLGQ